MIERYGGATSETYAEARRRFDTERGMPGGDLVAFANAWCADAGLERTVIAATWALTATTLR